MAKNIHGIGVGLSAPSLAELDAFAKEKGVSRSEAARVAIAVGLPMLKARHCHQRPARTDHTRAYTACPLPDR